jgi:glycosyltransferase involved in cell wall biosynthesis
MECTPKEYAREKLKISLGKFVILVYGNLTYRKGIISLVSAINRLNDQSITILLAGQQSPDIAECLKSCEALKLINSNQLALSEGFHDDNKEKIVFSSADIVWLGYTGSFYGSSGVLLQACSLGLPLLATKNGIIGWLTRKHNLGIEFDPNNVSEISTALLKIKNDLELYKTISINCKEFSLQHNRNQFRKSISNMMNNAFSIINV